MKKTNNSMKKEGKKSKTILNEKIPEDIKKKIQEAGNGEET